LWEASNVLTYEGRSRKRVEKKKKVTETQKKGRLGKLGKARLLESLLQYGKGGGRHSRRKREVTEECRELIKKCLQLKEREKEMGGEQVIIDKSLG